MPSVPGFTLGLDFMPLGRVLALSEGWMGPKVGSGPPMRLQASQTVKDAVGEGVLDGGVPRHVAPEQFAHGRLSALLFGRAPVGERHAILLQPRGPHPLLGGERQAGQVEALPAFDRRRQKPSGRAPVHAREKSSLHSNTPGARS